ncbi:NAD-dependent epimerase/dehydratase family protein [Pseudomonas juntendi]|uniref:NAD-dependent epimerase/dehydratase family protein n=1 Tax=Pseudomonas juntendi TaxID=2666183 RepID=A0ABZ2JGN6_9PSED|nr:MULTISPECIES: NAD-dependent epimerase/dehydratase family protein [Pseudomonas]MDH2012956.1 NAD-dependent epimerase/dehydratase family protein [Pseudomonas juntendi]QDR67334.1 NAD-dependent epimerase/dehydratase family protein [Pseudomonas sp. BJP69]
MPKNLSSSSPILVTGGAGFIGSHLVDALLADGYAVRVIDNFTTGKRSNLPLGNPGLQLIEGNVADASIVTEAVSGCQAVVHLAAVASVQASVDDPIRTHQSNFIGTLNICEAMRLAKVKRVLFASSAAIYGNNGEGTAISEDTPKSPLTPYASDKLASEHYLNFYHHQHGLLPVIYRFFNIYGPRQDPSSPYSGVISIFADRARKNLPISVFGDGEQTRDFVFVRDLINLLQQGLLLPSISVETVNVGLSQATSLNQILNAFSQNIGRLPKVTYHAARNGDIRHSMADNQRLFNLFDMPEPTTINSGIAQLIEQDQ